ncbi:lamin tail domain-containing protein, partial [Patescibacteria group bacterium]|nr:lamin tail domain-containing protein [Patescibacteria group bacterium]
MSKKLILVFVLVFFFFWFNLARAEVVINEIMYAPASGSNYEWVEIFNSGTTSIDLQGWRFFHGETNSGPLTLRNGSTTILQPLEYAIIAKSPSVVTDYAWLNFSNMILSASTLSLPDDADNTYIAIASDTNKTISNSVIYDTSLGGSKDSGNSLSKINNIWVGATPTPGTSNETISPPPPPVDDSSNDDSNSSDNNNSSSASGSTPKVAEIQKIKTQIIGKTLGFVGLPLSLDATTLGLSGEQLRYGKYFWNFGDGDSKETEIMYSGKFTHIYFYPGDYVISLFYYSNYYSDIPDASNQIVVKIIGADISISRVGDEKDFFVELSNNTDYSVDISNWILVSDVKSFTIPRNTILASKKKMIISPKITNFSISDKDTLKLLTPEREIAFIYAAFTPKVSQEPFLRNSKATSTTSPDSNIQESSLNSEIEIPANGLQASVISSDLPENNSSNSYLPILSFFIFISAGAGSVYFIRRRKISSKE